jgi:response regulator RpfG family c-di-GMP phosphodiesterase
VQAPIPHSRAGKRILIVEDLDLMRESLRLSLCPDYAVVAVASAEEGLEALEDLEPGVEFGVVLCDQQLPGMTGIGFLGLISKSHPDTVRIMLSGHSEVDLVLNAMVEGGVYRFLQKPCPRRELLDAMRSGFAQYAELASQRASELRLNAKIVTLADAKNGLEQLVESQARQLHRLQEFALDLNCAKDLDEIVQAVASAALDLLMGRCVQVRIEDLAGQAIEADSGLEPAGSSISEAIISCEGQIGEIIVSTDPEGPGLLTADESNTLASVAATAAVAVHNEFRRQQQEAAQAKMIQGLAIMTEQRDGETGTHLERVSRFSELLASSLAEQESFRTLITDDFQKSLVIGTRMHDIGKIAIADALLLKPGRLTPNEWEVMRSHTVLGAQAIEALILDPDLQPTLEMARQIALCHHERWDGSGYPGGLAGEEIPLAARILSLADVYDALTSARPYKEAWSHEEAAAWIEDAAGTSFDPQIVDAFQRVSESMCRLKSELADPPVEGDEESRPERRRRLA